MRRFLSPSIASDFEGSARCAPGGQLWRADAVAPSPGQSPRQFVSHSHCQLPPSCPGLMSRPSFGKAQSTRCSRCPPGHGTWTRRCPASSEGEASEQSISHPLAARAIDFYDKRIFCDRRHGASPARRHSSRHQKPRWEKNHDYDQECSDCSSRLRPLGIAERSIRWIQTVGRTAVRVQGRCIQTVQRIAHKHGKRWCVPASKKVPGQPGVPSAI
jgi:hypothetical protein